MAKWDWRPKVARFWNRTVGRLVPRLQVRQAADVVIDRSPAPGWSQAVTDGSMPVQSWHQQMRDELRRNYIEQYLAGRGGTGQMTAKDYGSIGGMLAEQYKWLDEMAAEVAAGNLTEGQVRMRVRMYINSSREAYERAHARAAEEAGLDSVRWVLDPNAEHCTGEPGCLELSQMGWQRTNPWPFRKGRERLYCGSGGTPCLTSCRCHTEYE